MRMCENTLCLTICKGRITHTHTQHNSHSTHYSETAPTCTHIPVRTFCLHKQSYDLFTTECDNPIKVVLCLNGMETSAQSMYVCVCEVSMPTHNSKMVAIPIRRKIIGFMNVWREWKTTWSNFGGPTILSVRSPCMANSIVLDVCACTHNIYDVWCMFCVCAVRLHPMRVTCVYMLVGPSLFMLQY